MELMSVLKWCLKWCKMFDDELLDETYTFTTLEVEAYKISYIVKPVSTPSTSFLELYIVDKVSYAVLSNSSSVYDTLYCHLRLCN
jgi:hypothetical protein